jgi:hypothetical protein
MAGKTLKKKTHTTLSGKRNLRSKRTTRSRAMRQGMRRPPVAILAAIGAVVIGLAAFGGTMLFTGHAGKTGDVPSYAADQITLKAKEASPDCSTKAVCG